MNAIEGRALPRSCVGSIITPGVRQRSTQSCVKSEELVMSLESASVGAENYKFKNKFKKIGGVELERSEVLTRKKNA